MLPAATKLYYTECAQQYFHSTRSAILTSAWKKMLHRMKLKARVLDLGCGSGRDVAYFARHGLRSVGLDYSLPLLKLARTVTSQPLILAEFAHLPFLQGSFDAVWSIGSLGHVPKCELPAVLSEIHRVLKPDAVFMASIKLGEGEGVDKLGRYLSCYQPREWQSVLETRGFCISELSVTDDTQEIAPNNPGQVKWIVCVARKEL